jgi:hypothetical protein
MTEKFDNIELTITTKNMNNVDYEVNTLKVSDTMNLEHIHKKTQLVRLN